MHTRVITAVVLLLSILLFPNQALASPPEEIIIDFEVYFTGPDSTIGQFTMEGAIDDDGSIYKVFKYTDDGYLHGVNVLEGENGTITMRFNLEIIPTGPTTARADVHFVIQSGTGAYENIHGVGKGESIIDFVAGSIIGTYSGKAHIDP